MLEQVQIKQRIVGGIVLLSLSIILVPLLMDDPREEVKILESNVAPWPEEQPLNLIEVNEEEFSPIVEPIAQQPAETTVPAKVASPLKKIESKVVEKSVAKKVTAKAPVKELSTKKASSGKQWEVQVVSYSRKSRKRAEHFLKRVKQKGYSVTLKEIKKQLRLVTEPLSSEKEAKEMKKKIDRDFKVDQVHSMIRLLK